jgi:transposase
MVAEIRGDYPSEWAAITTVASKLGIGSSETASGTVGGRPAANDAVRPGRARVAL